MQGLVSKSFASHHKEAAKQSYGLDKSLGPQHGLHCLRNSQFLLSQTPKRSIMEFF